MVKSKIWYPWWRTMSTWNGEFEITSEIIREDCWTTKVRNRYQIGNKLPSTTDMTGNYKGSMMNQNEMDIIVLDSAENSYCLVVKDLRLRYFDPTSSSALIINDRYASAIYSKYFKEQKRMFKEIFSIHGAQKTKKPDKDKEIGDCSYQPARVCNTPELPSLEIINSLIRRFFDFCYPLFTFIDEKSFMRDVNVILAKENLQTNLNPLQESTLHFY